MSKFREKTTVIESRQICAYTDMLGVDGIAAWCGGTPGQIDPGPAFLMIPTNEGTMRADVFDWVVKSPDGRFYPVGDDLFAMTYEPIEGDAQ